MQSKLKELRVKSMKKKKKYKYKHYLISKWKIELPRRKMSTNLNEVVWKKNQH